MWAAGGRRANERSRVDMIKAGAGQDREGLPLRSPSAKLRYPFGTFLRSQGNALQHFIYSLGGAIATDPEG
jgi:hypothetical protein